MRSVLFALAAAALLAIAPSGPAAVIINEFMAENDGSLKDQDGASPDWIELHNTGPNLIDLAGWHLTDTATNLTRWTFPSTPLPAGGYLVVFASGKDRTNSAPQHTSFALEASGGYLALVDSNGVIVSQFNYPRQHRNVSYGTNTGGGTQVHLITSARPARWLAPTDGTLGSSWTTPAFDDSTWTAATTPLRYDVGSVVGGVGSPVLGVDFNRRNVADNSTNTAAGFQSFVISSNVNNAAIQTQATVRVLGAHTITLSNAAPHGYDDRLRSQAYTNYGAFTDSLLLRDFVFSRDQTGLGGLDVAISGLNPAEIYSIKLWSWDQQSGGTRTSDWYTNGTLAYANWSFDGRVYPSNNLQYTFSFTGVADGTGTLLFSGRRKSTSVDTAGAASFGVFINALQVAPVTLVPSTNGNVSPMTGATPTLYTRQNFIAENPADIAFLTLRIRYDDGFVAYLNGTEVARRNAPATPDWLSNATTSHDGATAEDIALHGAPGLLINGTNVLAIHGLNLAAGDSDFLLEPQLLATLASVTSGYFSPGTPGTNNGPAFYGVVSDTKFSVDRGFHDAPFSLSITCATAGASIYFTTNGSEPTPANGTLFTAPISTSGQSFIRAQAYRAGWVPGGVDTHSYIFLTDVLRQSNNIPGYPTTWQANYPADYGMDSNIVNHPTYGTTISNDMRSIPSLMLVTEQNGLWHSSTGIYPNATSSGPAWERAASAELIAGDGGTEFATTAKLEMHGNASRDNARTPKHSMRLNFNSDYGPTKLDYDWFGGGVKSHDAIILRSAGFVDGWAGRYADNTIYTSSETGEQFRGLRYRPETTCYLRDVWMKESFRDMGWISSRSSFAHVYLNGLYWGLYQPSERYGAYYFTEHIGGEEGAWDVLVGEDNNGPTVLVDGSLTDWNSLLALVASPVASESTYAAITNAVEIDNLIDYMLIHIFGESEDWPRHNWYAAHRRATNGVPGTKFIFTVWDQELTLDRLVRRNRVDAGNGAGGAGEQYSPARIYHQLRNWPEFRLRFGDRVHKHLFNGGPLAPTNNVARWLALASGISNAVVGESARWGDARKIGVPAGQIGTSNTFTRNEWWQPEIDKTATNFFQKLTADNVARLQAAALYPLVGAPEFSQFGGAVGNGFALAISHTNAGGVIYFTTDETDPRAYGSGAVSAGAQAYAAPLPVNTPTAIRARVLDGTNWSALVAAVFYPPQDLSKLALTEIMFRPPALGAIDGDEFEFIELKNTGTNSLNLSGLAFSGITFTFSNGTTLAPGGFFVLVRNAATFAFKYPGVPIHGLYTGALNNGGENIALTHALGGPIFSVSYGTRAPWPVTADGFGFSLVQVNPITQAPDTGAKWRASTNPGGSPGADDPAPTLAPVLINELLTHSILPALDQIELFNPTATNVDIGGWFLTDDAGVPMKFRIPDGTVINAGAFAVFTEAQFNATPGTNGSFSLNSSGEEVYLFSGDAGTNLTGYAHGLAFGAAAAGVPFGRHVNSVGEEQFPAQLAPSLNASNAGPRVGPVVINEIHYNPAAGGDEFVELRNITGTNVSLAGGTNGWDLNGVGFTFATNVSIPAGGFILLVATNPADFITAHAVPPGVAVFGPYSGNLQDSGERIDLRFPGVPDTNGVPRIVVDTVRYNDKAPWPPAADGSGSSLQRRTSSQYGDDPTNWMAGVPSPGRENDDRDGDGLPDSWEILFGTNPDLADADADPDLDGQTNAQEYLAGTHPNDAQSRLRVERIGTTPAGVQFEFTAASNRTYAVEFKRELTASSWTSLTNIPADPQSRIIQIEVPATNNARFFRVKAP